MRIYTVILTTLAALAVMGCSTTPPANQTSTGAVNTANQTNQQAAETKSANASLSPTETLKALNEASTKKDVEAVKSYLSQRTLDLIKQRAEEENRTVDEILKEDNGSPAPQVPETRGEKIEGDRATVEVKNPMTGAYEPFPLVKENGTWKVALDVYLEQLEERFEEEMIDPSANSPEKPNANKP